MQKSGVAKAKPAGLAHCHCCQAELTPERNGAHLVCEMLVSFVRKQLVSGNPYFTAPLDIPISTTVPIAHTFTHTSRHVGYMYWVIPVKFSLAWPDPTQSCKTSSSSGNKVCRIENYAVTSCSHRITLGDPVPSGLVPSSTPSAQRMRNCWGNSPLVSLIDWVLS